MSEATSSNGMPQKRHVSSLLGGADGNLKVPQEQVLSVKQMIEEALAKLSNWAQQLKLDVMSLNLEPAPQTEDLMRTFQFHPEIRAEQNMIDLNVTQTEKIQTYLELYLERARGVHKYGGKLRAMKSKDDRQLALRVLDKNMFVVEVKSVQQDSSHVAADPEEEDPTVLEVKIAEKMSVGDNCTSVFITQSGELQCSQANSGTCKAQHDKHHPCKHMLFVNVTVFHEELDIDSVRSLSVDTTRMHTLLNSDWLADLQASVTPSQCGICLDDFSVQSRREFCNASPLHVYHRNCINIWRRINDQCPLCRASYGFSRHESSPPAAGVVANQENADTPFRKAFTLVPNGEMEARRIFALVAYQKDVFVKEQALRGITVRDLFAAVDHKKNAASRFVVVVSVSNSAMPLQTSRFSPYPCVVVNFQSSTTYAFLESVEGFPLPSSTARPLYRVHEELVSNPTTSASSSSTTTAGTAAAVSMSSFQHNAVSLQGIIPGYRVLNNHRTSEPSLVFLVAYKNLLPVNDWFYDSSDAGLQHLSRYLENTGRSPLPASFRLDVQQRFFYRNVSCKGNPLYRTKLLASVNPAIPPGLGSPIAMLQHKCDDASSQCAHNQFRRTMLSKYISEMSAFMPEFVPDSEDSSSSHETSETEAWDNRKRRRKRRNKIIDSDDDDDHDVSMTGAASDGSAALETQPMDEDTDGDLTSIPPTGIAYGSTYTSDVPAGPAAADSSSSLSAGLEEWQLSQFANGPPEAKAKSLIFGTIGALFCYSSNSKHDDSCGQLYALTCRHVMQSVVPAHGSVLHHQLFSPPIYFEDIIADALKRKCSNLYDDVLKQLKKLSLTAPDASVCLPRASASEIIDAMLIPIRHGSVQSQFRYFDEKSKYDIPQKQQGPSGELIERAKLGERSRTVFKVGAFTGWTQGEFAMEPPVRQEDVSDITLRMLDENTSFLMYHISMNSAEEGTQLRSLCPLIPVKTQIGSRFSDHGDSGSLVFTEDDRCAVGMIACGDPTYTWLHPLQSILQAFDPPVPLQQTSTTISGQHWQLHITESDAAFEANIMHLPK